MNDLIRSASYPSDTGLTGTDAHGFTAGQTLSLRLSSPTGQRVRDVTVTIPAGATSASIGLTGMPDTLAESTETITIDIASVTNGQENGSRTVTASMTTPVKMITKSMTKLASIAYRVN